MGKRTIEVNDCLEESAQSAQEIVADRLKEWCDDNEPECREDLPDIGRLDYDGCVHEAVDGCVPIYYSDIDSAWFLHKAALIEAYEAAGVGDNPMESDGGAAIYYWIYNYVCEGYDELCDQAWEAYAAGTGKGGEE